MNLGGVAAAAQMLAKRLLAKHLRNFGEKEQVRFRGVPRHQKTKYIAYRLAVRRVELNRTFQANECSDRLGQIP